jgi:hypothetical protein
VVLLLGLKAQKLSAETAGQLADECSLTQRRGSEASHGQLDGRNILILGMTKYRQLSNSYYSKVLNPVFKNV